MFEFSSFIFVSLLFVPPRSLRTSVAAFDSSTSRHSPCCSLCNNIVVGEGELKKFIYIVLVEKTGTYYCIFCFHSRELC